MLFFFHFEFNRIRRLVESSGTAANGEFRAAGRPVDSFVAQHFRRFLNSHLVKFEETKEISIRFRTLFYRYDLGSSLKYYFAHILVTVYATVSVMMEIHSFCVAKPLTIL